MFLNTHDDFRELDDQKKDSSKTSFLSVGELLIIGREAPAGEPASASKTLLALWWVVSTAAPGRSSGLAWSVWW